MPWHVRARCSPSACPTRHLSAQCTLRELHLSEGRDWASRATGHIVACIHEGDILAAGTKAKLTVTQTRWKFVSFL